MARWAAALVAILLAACGSTTVSDHPNLGVANGTTLTVTLVVNGRALGDFESGAGPSIDVSGLPALPWTVEARSPSGRVLTSMTVEPGQVWSRTSLNGVGEHNGVFGRVDLSCGRLTIWAGDVTPSGPIHRLANRAIAIPDPSGDVVVSR
jgi:hypothetical protein